MNELICKHPIVAHKISILRNRETSTELFRKTLNELVGILGVWATEDLDLIETGKFMSPLSEYTGLAMKDKVALFPILRAGLGFVDGMLDLIPHARILHLGLYREKSTLLPVEYYNKLPADCKVDLGIVLDPMVATAGTAISAVNILKDWGLTRIKFICALASSEGLKALRDTHPDIQIYCAAMDDVLDDQGYVHPGLGDAGDRIFKTNHDQM